MRAEIKAYWSPDVDNLETYQPADPSSFGYFLQFLIGPADAKGEESFGMMVCTPKWLESQRDKHDIVVGRHYILVFEYDFPRLLAFLKEAVSSVSEDSWHKLAEKLARVGEWEFEDYDEGATST